MRETGLRTKAKALGLTFLAAFCVQACFIGRAAAGEADAVSVRRAYDVALVYFERRDYASALAVLEPALAASPHYLPMWRLMARIRYGARQYERVEEAVGVCLLADPGDVDVATLAFRNLFERPDLDGAERVRRLSELVGVVGAEIFFSAVSSLIAELEGIGDFAGWIAAAGRGAGALPEEAARVFEFYSGGRFREAALLLEDGRIESALGGWAGPLFYLVGRALAFTDDFALAPALLSRAAERDFAPAETADALSLAYRRLGRYREAGAVFLAAWRRTDEPGFTISRMADDFIAAGEFEEALNVLDMGAASFPRLPSLQAKRLLVLRLLSRDGELREYAAELERNDMLPGLGYGRALIAESEGREDDAFRELERVREFVTGRLGYALDLEMTESWLEHGPRSLDLERNNASRALLQLAARNWELGRRTEALMLWDRGFAGAFPGSRIALLNVVAMLAEAGLGREAALLMSRRAADMPALDVVVAMLLRNQWTGVESLLDALDVPAGTSWPALFRALARLHVASEEEARAALRDFFRYPPETAPLRYGVLNPDGTRTAAVLTLADHRRLRLELATLLAARDFHDLYAVMLQSPQWRDGDMDAAGSARAFFDALFRAGRDDALRSLLDDMLGDDPANPTANLYLALLERRLGNVRAAIRSLDAGLESAGGFEREYMLALLEQLNGNPGRALEHYLECVRLEPDDPDIRLAAIRGLAAEHRYAEAWELTRRLEELNRTADGDVASHLALAYGDLGAYALAEPLWRALTERYPESLPPLSALGATLNRMERPAETLAALSARARATAHPELCALLSEACLALGRGDEALGWADLGLETAPEDSRLLSNAVYSAESMVRPDLVERYSLRYLAVNPLSPAINGSYGQALMDQEKWDDVYRHNLKVLETNQHNWAALERESARVKACEADDRRRREEYAWRADRLIADNFPNDPALILRAGVTAAGAGDFRYAIPTLQWLRSLGPNSSSVSLLFNRVAIGDAIGGVPLEEVAAHLDVLRREHAPSPLATLLAGPNPDVGTLRPVPLVTVVGRSRPEALEKLDAYLESVGGRAVLVVGEESLSERTPVWADIVFLRGLAATGRWEFVLTDHSPARLPDREDGRFTEFWLEPKWLGDRYETPGEMRLRLAYEMRRLLDKARRAGIDACAWLHPSWGDYGHRLIESDYESMLAYRGAVGEVFPLALTQTPSGLHVAGGDPLRVAIRSVGAGVDPEELSRSLRFNHPTRRAVLELAKVKSWHAQYSTADGLFDLSREYGLNPAETAYFQGRNSLYEGDVPQAICYAHEAFDLDPEAERADDLFSDAHRLLRPLLVVSPRHWEDSNDEKYSELAADLSFHVSNKWELRVSGGVRRWKDADGDSMEGAALRVGARYYFRPENYLQGEIGGVAPNGAGKSHLEAHAAWFGRFSREALCADGQFSLEYHREGLETYRAQAARIRTNRFALNTATRLADRWEVDFNPYFTNRTDGNDTWGLLFRPTYRFRDLPMFRFGYWLALADSDVNPEAYYAPVDYVAHQAVAMYRHNITPRLVFNALGSYGRAKTRGTDWREVIRANANLDYRLNDCFAIGGGYQYLKLPDYELKQYTLSLSARF